ncbi:LOW QUALITY PROTEIN: U-box domain-containing protein 41-like [Ananas comosus]|uniref:RING-type E3 ubiquitin transferase n=1 Tax=Ananas comosus TaxID=4615 RepID=A0A6P5EQ39_ANACO|nr:LOW QUALITY PROTEIN: U-box domain-containing protein 41-like [Ananas comosus]
MGSGKARWKLSFHRSPSSSPSSSFSAEAPPEFLCPICRSLMADPVIVPSGDTFERRCIEACSALDFTPPTLSSCFPPDTPPPISVRTRRVNPNPRFSPPSSSASSSSYPSSSSFPSSEMAAGAAEETLTQETPTKAREAPEASPTASCDRLEEEILTQLKDSEPSEQEAAMASLRQATRESRERRLALCTPRLLAALRPMLLSRYAGVQVNAAAALVNLSLEAPNKVRIVRSGAVPPLVDVLKGGHPEARDHAAGALFSLALEEENRAAIGVLGAIEPLIQLFTRASSSSSSSSDAHRARRDAGTALYHLSVASTNQSKMARTPGAVKALLALATAPNSDSAALRRLALMVAGNLAGCADGRAALMDAGAVAALVGLMRDAAGTPEEEYCVAALYGMSKGSLRFRGAARAAGAEAVLMRVAEDSSGGRAGVRRQMARRTLRAMRGEDDDAAAAAAAAFGTEFDDDGSIVSEGLVSFRRRHQRDFGTGGGGGGGSNTTEF